MSEIDSLGTNFYYAGTQNAAASLSKSENDKKVKTSKTKFSSLLNKKEEISSEFETSTLPPEIKNLSFDDAVIFLKDKVDNAGNLLEQEISEENVNQFKDAVSNFLKFIVANNFKVSSKKSRRPQYVSPVNFFSSYNTQPRLKDPKVQINIINEKLDNLTKEMLSTQRNNLLILQSIGEIKGLIIDLMSN